MTAVLLNSIKVGSTAWFSTRRGNALKVQGMEEGDRLLVKCQPGSTLSVVEDGFLPLPGGVEMVSIEHQKAQGVRENGGVCVDLVRKKKWES